VLTDFSLHLGAPSVMSPEQLREWKEPTNNQPPVDWRSDLYAFGACLYKLTTGAYPFPVTQTNPMQAVDEIYRYQLINKLPVDLPRDRNPANPDLQTEAVNTVIHQLTSKSRSGRTMKGRITKLEDVLDLLVQAGTVRKGWVTPIFAIAVLVIALLLLAGALVMGSLQATNANSDPGQNNQGNQVVVFTTQAALSGYPTATPTSPPTPVPTRVVVESEGGAATDAAQTIPEPATNEPTEPDDTSVPTEITPSEPTLQDETPEILDDEAVAATTDTPIPLDQNSEITGTTEITDTVAPAGPELTCDAGIELLNPQVSQVISGTVIFQGLVSQADLDYYKIEYLPPGGDQWSCCLVNPTYELSSPEALGQWDTTTPQFGPGQYQIRLVAVKLDGNFTTCETRVTVEK
jgi:serine/threonine protein kinase